MFTLVKCISISIKADVQEIEGINSMIKRIGERAPNMSLGLLWARIAIKKRLNNDVRTKGRPSSSWAARRDNSSMILDMATDFSEESHQLVTTKDPLRWTAPALLNDVPTAKQLLKPCRSLCRNCVPHRRHHGRRRATSTFKRSYQSPQSPAAFRFRALTCKMALECT